jgi:integration host factor subunit beta
VIKSELIHALKKKLPEFQERDIALSVNCILTQMTEALVQGERIEIRGFGSFDLHHRPARIARNPKTGVAVHSPAKVTVHFKAGKDMKDRVNEGSDHCGITE